MLNNNLLKMPRLMHHLCDDYLLQAHRILVLAGCIELRNMRLGCKSLTVNVKGFNNTEYRDVITWQGK